MTKEANSKTSKTTKNSTEKTTQVNEPAQNSTTAQNTNQANFTPNDPSKDRIAAGILALLLGGFGVHHFYLGNVGLGVLYLCFCWTGIPAIAGIIEGVIYLTETEEQFQYKHVHKK